jgi:hypothetical protein
MNKITLIICAILLFFSCKRGRPKVIATQKDTVIATAGTQIIKTDRIKVTKQESSLAIEGLYVAKPLEGGTESCDMSVRIKKRQAGGYTYHFTINDTRLTGRVTLSKSEDKKDTYITFKGIKWAEYEGDISKREDSDADDNSPDLELPVGVSGQLSGNKIVIQNSGNAMNYYTVFSECGSKYIRLVKQ